METWKSIPGLPSIYQASSLGRIRCLPYVGKTTCRWSKNEIDVNFPLKILTCRNLTKKGYIRHKLNYVHWFAHRLVAITYLPNPENKPQINHKNGIKTDNRPENLEWVTNQENRDHAKANGLISIGENNNSKLKNSDILIIRSMLKDKIPQRVIAQQFNVSQQTISHVKLDSWQHIRE